MLFTVDQWRIIVRLRRIHEFFFSTTVDLSPRSAYSASVTISLENPRGNRDAWRFWEIRQCMMQLASEVVWVRADSSERRAWRGGINKSVCLETLFAARETRIVARGEIHVCSIHRIFFSTREVFPKLSFSSSRSISPWSAMKNCLTLSLK
jgi:hypothetical protein